MRPSAVSTVLHDLLPTRQPLFLWGPPGVGKSSLVRQAADRLRLKTIDIRAVLLDPVDLRGLPSVHEGRARWCQPDFLPRDGKGVLFLDELAQAPPLVQSACLQLVLDRRIGEYELPEGWTVVAASNRTEDRAGAHRLISPLLNRFLHLDVEVSLDDWQAWALSAGISPEVRSFLRFRPALLFQFDPTAGVRSFPTPRSWEFVSRVLAVARPEHLHAVVAGCVGEGPAAEFVGYLRIYRGLPAIEPILAAPDTCTLPTEPSILYALVGVLAERAKDASNKVLEALYKLANRLPSEFGALLVRDVVAINRASLLLPAAQRWLASHAGVLKEASNND